MMGRPAAVLEHLGAGVGAGDQQVEAAVVVEVAGRQAAAHFLDRERRSGLGAGVPEADPAGPRAAGLRASGPRAGRSGAEVLEQLVRLPVAQAGLEPEAASLYPSELSGGMIKRAALARAMALDPELLFLDEPTSGLDPTSAGSFDELILKLKDLLGLTVLMVTHDLDSLWGVADRVAVLGDGKLRGVDSMEALSTSTQPHIREYFKGPRAQRARERQ